MTEAEAFELILLCCDMAISSFGLYVTIAFAFMTVSYFVGVTLTTFQSFLLCGLYVFASGVCILTLYIMIVTYFELKAGVSGGIAAMDNIPLWNETLWTVYPTSACIVGVFAGLLFNWNIRRTNAA